MERILENYLIGFSDLVWTSTSNKEIIRVNLMF